MYTIFKGLDVGAHGPGGQAAAEMGVHLTGEEEGQVVVEQICATHPTLNGTSQPLVSIVPGCVIFWEDCP